MKQMRSGISISASAPASTRLSAHLRLVLPSLEGSRNLVKQVVPLDVQLLLAV